MMGFTVTVKLYRFQRQRNEMADMVFKKATKSMLVDLTINFSWTEIKRTTRQKIKERQQK